MCRKQVWRKVNVICEVRCCVGANSSQQSGRPSGWLGAFIGRIMAGEMAGANPVALDLLDLDADDRAPGSILEPRALPPRRFDAQGQGNVGASMPSAAKRSKRRPRAISMAALEYEGYAREVRPASRPPLSMAVFEVADLEAALAPIDCGARFLYLQA